MACFVTSVFASEKSRIIVIMTPQIVPNIFSGYVSKNKIKNSNTHKIEKDTEIVCSNSKDFSIYWKAPSILYLRNDPD